MMPVNVNSSTCINFGKGNNKKDSKFKAGDHVKISRYRNIFVKGYTSNCTEEFF